jgi:hypothetical protein
MVVLITRSRKSSAQQNAFDRSRWWSRREVAAVSAAIKAVLPAHEVVEFADSNSDLMNCVPCQIRLFSVATMTIGVSILLILGVSSFFTLS